MLNQSSVKMVCKIILAADTESDQVPTFKITDSKLCVVAFSTQDNVKLLKQLESGFKRTVKDTIKAYSRYRHMLL